MRKTIITVTLLFLVISTILSFAPQSIIIHAAYVPPANNRLQFNFNHDWRFCMMDLANKGLHPESTTFTEDPGTQTWQDISLPHCFNDIWFREWTNTNTDANDPEHSQDDAIEHNYFGKVWYRKHFTIDSAYSGRKVVLEFQGISLIANFYVNGQSAGSYQSGVGPCGVDITNLVNFGSDNLIAVEVNNNNNAKLDQYGGISVPYGWPFNPDYGGINRDVTLHIFDKCYQTLPLYRGLGTQGTYVYAQNIDTLNKTANITFQAEVKNEYTTAQNVTYNATVVDRNGNTVLTTSDVVQNISAGQTALLKTTANMTGIHFWATDYPYLYQVYTSLKINGNVVDVYQTPMGVRSVTFTGTDGLHINGHRVFLKGYAPRTPMEWPCVLIPPDWMVEYDFKLMHDDNGNFLRPMHMAPRKNQVDAADKFGIIMAVPAVAGENQPTTWDPNEWQFRLDAMRDVMIYFRNNPSVIFYEGNNGDLYTQNMQDMVNLRKTWDPYGGRYMGTRSTGNTYAEYWSPMDGASTSSTVPSWDAEYARGESPRRVWDDYTPMLNPRYNTTDLSWNIITPITPAPDTTSKYVTGGYFAVASNYYRRIGPDIAGNDNSISHYPTGYFRLMSSEEMVKENLAKYYGRYAQSAFVAPLATRQSKGVMVGGAKIIWADSTTDGRMQTLEVTRVSGVVDSARLPKEVYYGLQVAQNDNPQVYIVGHWNYPAGTTKTVYVAGNTDQVKLITYDNNGTMIKDYGYGDNSDFVKKGDQINHYLFVFNNVQWQSGSIKAIGYNGGVQVAQNQKYTAGTPSKIKLTTIVGPEGSWRADGNDVAMIDVEVVDANGNRCPTYEDRIDFTCSGQGKFLGGYNSGYRWSTNKDCLTSGYHFNVECGINRVFVRATRTAGAFTLNATASGLTSASITVNSAAFTVTNGLTTVFPQKYTPALGTEPTPVQDIIPSPGPTPTPTQSTPSVGVMANMQYTGVHAGEAQVVSGAQNGMQVYMDNSCTFSNLPSYLIGGDYIKAFLSDATEGSSTDQYQFTVAKYAYIYELVDSANDPPVHDYNDSYQWQQMPETVTVNGRTMNIYRTCLMPPYSNGYFATNLHGITRYASNCNMYIVFAVSVEQELQTPSLTVTASSTQAGNLASYAIDANTATRWGAADGTFPQWLKIDLGQVCSIGGYEINWFTNATRSYKYKIELSNDDVTYNLAVDQQNNSQTGIYQDRTPQGNQFTGRYVKVTVTGSSAGWASLNEIRIFGMPGGSSPTPTPTSASTPTPTKTPTVTPTPTPVTTPTPTATQTPTGTGTLLSQGKTASASDYQANNPPASGNDGNTSTRWAATDTTYPQWWKVDLGAAKSLTRVDISWYSSSNRAYKYKIEVSSDDVTYTAVIDKTGNTTYGDTSDNVAVSGRYVRITVTGCTSGAAYASFYECKVYGN